MLPTRGLLSAALAVFLAGPVVSYGQVEEAPERRIEEAEVRSLREQAEQDDTLDETLRKQVSSIYDQALNSLASAETWRAQAVAFRKELANIDQRLEDYRKRLSSLPPEPNVEVPDNATASQLEAMLAEERTHLDAARGALRDVEQLTEERSNRRTEIAGRLGELEREIDDLSDSLRGEAVQDAHPAIVRATRRRLLARREAATAERERLRDQLALLEARATLLPWQRDEAQREVDFRLQAVLQLARLSNEKWREEALLELEGVKELCRRVVELDPETADVAGETEELAERLWGADSIIAKSEIASRELVDTRKHITDLDRIGELTLRRFEAVGEGGSVRQWWPKVPEDFPTLAEMQKSIRDRKRILLEIQQDLIAMEEDRAAIQNLSVETSVYVRNSPLQGEELAAFRQVAREVIMTKRGLLDKLIQQYGRYSDQVTELNTLAGHLEQDSSRVVSFLYERLYWWPSVENPLTPSLADTAGAFLWLSSPAGWSEVGSQFWTKVKSSKMTALRVLLLVGLIVFRRRIKARLASLGSRVRDPETDSFRWTLEAAVHTVLLGAPLPLALIALSRFLESEISTTFTLAVNQSLYYLGVIAALFEFTRQLLRPDGLAEAHFGWSSGVTRVLHRGLLWPECLFLPLMYVSIHMGTAGLRLESPDELQAYNNSLGRLTFILAMGVLAAALYSVFRPRMAGRSAELRKLFRSVSMIAYPATTIAVVLPAVAALLGYYLTAYLAAYQFLRTASLALALVVLGGLLKRWRTEQTRSVAKRKSMDATLAAQAERQVQQLFRFALISLAAVGLYSIWAGALPAVQALQRVQIYPSLAVLDKAAPEELAIQSSATGVGAAADEGTAKTEFPLPQEGEGPVDTESESTVLTLLGLLKAILAALITFALARDIPGLIELALLKRTHMDAGARVAVSTLARYVVLIGGVSITFGLLGLNWSKIQWLAAALTFGLGFGLQEIVANFVSGLILLLERPVRVGDAVTIGNLQGRVTRIQIRATTVTLWDRSEMVVPNKEFITTKLINWTLSDSRRRIDVPIRVAYGADVQKVKQTLLQVAKDHPNVISDPPPSALLVEFGDDALKFELRFFVEFGQGLSTKDEIHVSIDRAFQEERIEFALPSLNIKVPAPALPPPSPAGSSG